jgi:ribosome-binding factor A
MASRRIERIAELIQQELSVMITKRQIKDPRLVGMVTITRVKVTPDLSQAVAYFSVMGTEKEQRSSAAALKSAATYMQGVVSRNLRLKKTPHLSFKEDTSMEEAFKIYHLLDQIKKDEEEK